MDRATGALIEGGRVEMSGHSPESRGLFRSFHFGYLRGRDPTERFAYGSGAPTRRRGRSLLGNTGRLCLLRRILRGRAACGWPRALRVISRPKAVRCALGYRGCECNSAIALSSISTCAPIREKVPWCRGRGCPPQTPRAGQIREITRARPPGSVLPQRSHRLARPVASEPSPSS